MQNRANMKRAEKILDDLESRFAEPEGKSAFQKSLRERTKNETLAIHMGIDPDAVFINKAKSAEQMSRMSMVASLEKSMENSRKFGGDPDLLKRQIGEIYGINPRSVEYANCNDATDIRCAAFLKLLEALREPVNKIDCDDLLDWVIETIKIFKQDKRKK